jgi:hypothetical protein
MIEELDMSTIPVLGLGRTKQHRSQVSLRSRLQLLKDKVRSARLAERMPPDVIQRIESQLSAISQENDPINQWNSYELAYESYIPFCSLDDLLGVFLRLRSRAHRLDEYNQAIWSNERFNQIDQAIRSGEVSSMLREEVATLARAIHECDLRRKRDLEDQSLLIRRALYLSALMCALAIVLMTVLAFSHVPVGTPWILVLTVVSGAIIGFLCATVQLRRRYLRIGDVRADRAGLFLFGALGGLAAGILALFLQFRHIPSLQLTTAKSSSLFVLAFCIIAFASGIAIQAFFPIFERTRMAVQSFFRIFKEPGNRDSTDPKTDLPGSAM